MTNTVNLQSGVPVINAHPVDGAQGKGFFAAVVKAVWVMAVLFWPLLKWVVSIEVVFQMLRMAYYWNTPGVHAGWTFLLHFTGFVALTYFVSAYRPKGI
jgi:hypothetical protein